MNEPLTLADVDRDGAIAEAAHAAGAAYSRAGFFRRAAAVGGGVAGAAMLSGGAAAPAVAATTRNDREILNFALTLEYLEAEFYTEAERKGALSGRTAKFARVVGAHERAHVQFLKKALGSRAVKRPRFDFGDTTGDQKRFQRTAMTLEDVGVTAYEGQAPSIDSKAILAAAGSILSVEARHAAWIRNIISATTDSDPSPAPDAVNPPRTKEQVLRIVRSTGFIVG